MPAISAPGAGFEEAARLREASRFAVSGGFKVSARSGLEFSSSALPLV
jgi:hypothetical protein